MIARALLLLPLLCGVAWGKPKEKPPEAAPSATAPPPPVSAKEVKKHDEVFAEYLAQMTSGQKARAADALVAVVDDPANVDFHGEAYALLGDLLTSLDLPYGALVAYVRAFGAATDANVADLGTRVPRAIELADKVGDLAVLERPFSANLGLGRTDDVRGRMAYLAAREHQRRDNFGTAIGILKMVKEGDPVYPEAKSLEAIMLNQQGRYEDALKTIEAAQRAGRDRDARYQDLLQLNLGRTWYGAGNYARAIEAYSKVSRASTFWPEAQFERAWAHFRIDDFNGTLSMLFSMDTPFFASFYFPEADLLRIYSMFLLCKFPESETEIANFKAVYTPVHEKLKAFVATDDAEAFAAARAFAETGKVGDLPKMIWRPWGEEDRLRASIDAIAHVEDEIKRMKGAAANPFTQRTREWLEARRDELVREEGGRIKARVSEQEQQIGQMLADSEIFTLDILRMKTQLFQQAAQTGKLPDAARTVERKDRVRKGWREWPFDGEIWADELGYYRISVRPECPASMRQSVADQ